MKSSYKKLGNYIQEVNKRDTDKKVTKLLGVSIRKVLMPSIANIIGTDMSTYKIIKKKSVCLWSGNFKKWRKNFSGIIG